MASVHSVEEFVIGVPNLADAERFFGAFGLQVRHEGDALGLYTVGHPHRWGRVFGNTPRKKLLWLTFGAYEGDLAALEKQLEQAGAVPIAPPEDADPAGLWMRSHEGVCIQVRSAAKVSPSRPAPRELAAEATLTGRAPARSKVARVHPLYLSHILLFTSD